MCQWMTLVMVVGSECLYAVSECTHKVYFIHCHNSRRVLKFCCSRNAIGPWMIRWPGRPRPSNFLVPLRKNGDICNPRYICTLKSSTHFNVVVVSTALALTWLLVILKRRCGLLDTFPDVKLGCKVVSSAAVWVLYWSLNVSWFGHTNSSGIFSSFNFRRGGLH